MKKEITEPAAYKQLLVDPFRGIASAINSNIDSIRPIIPAMANTYPIANSACNDNSPMILEQKST
jgi:hypothetical protein